MKRWREMKRGGERDGERWRDRKDEEKWRKRRRDGEMERKRERWRGRKAGLLTDAGNSHLEVVSPGGDLQLEHTVNNVQDFLLWMRKEWRSRQCMGCVPRAFSTTRAEESSPRALWRSRQCMGCVPRAFSTTRAEESSPRALCLLLDSRIYTHTHTHTQLVGTVYLRATAAADFNNFPNYYILWVLIFSNLPLPTLLS